jgi:ankyrin repeat protein
MMIDLLLRAELIFMAINLSQNSDVRIISQSHADFDMHMETQLWLAVVTNNLNAVRYWLEEGADPDIKHDAGKTVVHEAVLNRNVVMIELFAEYDADFNMRDDQHMSALDHVGAEYDGTDETPLLPILQCLLRHGADPKLDVTCPLANQTLYWAAYKGFTRVVSALLQYEVDPRVENDGIRAYHEALEGGHLDLAALLARFEALHARVAQTDFKLSLTDVLQHADVQYVHILERAEALNLVETSMRRGAPRDQFFGSDAPVSEDSDTRLERTHP